MPAPEDAIPTAGAVPRPLRAEREAGERGPGPEDPDLARLTGLLSDLVEALHERGDAALEIRDGLPSFQVTLRAYCRGYLDGRRGAREE